MQDVENLKLLPARNPDYSGLLKALTTAGVQEPEYMLEGKLFTATPEAKAVLTRLCCCHGYTVISVQIPHIRTTTTLAGL